MKWETLASDGRLGKGQPQYARKGRSVFHRDYDRVVFCSAFRRLQDKTQVFPLAKSDYVRTRLTHSLEASCVGRSLGIEVGVRLKQSGKLPDDVDSSDIGMIVSTACLAHDIGNPPFGHPGEQAIQEWFEGRGSEFLKLLQASEEKEDFRRFEGNAQGFRILARLQHPEDEGGLQLTHATLATFSKYPTSSIQAADEHNKSGVSEKKHGFFHSDKELFRNVAENTGLLPKKHGHGWHRHPLAYLVEASDDICYSIIDLEDGFRRGHVSFDDATDLLLHLIDDKAVKEKLDMIGDRCEKLSFLRAKAINALVFEVTEQFMVQEDKLLNGTFDDDILKHIPNPRRDAIREIKCVDRDKVYTAREVIEIEVPGFNVLGGLLDAFVWASQDVAENHDKASGKSSTLLKLVPGQFLSPAGRPHDDPYKRLLSMTDFICGMTDRYAVELYKQISGMSL